MNEPAKFTFIGVSKKPKMGGVEMGAFVVDWKGEVRRISVAIEDELLGEWGYNKMGMRIEPDGDAPTLTQLLEMLGTYYLTELLALREEPHGYIFSTKDFIGTDGKTTVLADVVKRLKEKRYLLHRPHQYE